MKDEKILGAQSATEDVSAGSIAPDAATARHTPGEWTVFVDGSHVSILATAHPSPTIALVTGGLDDVYEQGLMGPTSHANAHLIAAAPELLEALKEMREVSAHMMRFIAGHVSPADMLRFSESMEHAGFAGFGVRAQAVIAKAERRS